MPTELQIDGAGELFASDEIDYERSLQRYEQRLPNFVRWARMRPQHHERLRDFLRAHPELIPAVAELVQFHKSEAFFGEEAGASTPAKEVTRSWFASGAREERLLHIARFASSRKELLEANRLVMMAMPELELGMLRAPCIGTDDDKMEAFYMNALEGNWDRGGWPFEDISMPA